ncbi:trypsin-like serine protease [Halobacteriovorax sp. GB3]|uniref:trypsin-like serine protease n=1 Tax=Halobacteriovorax sp. GB3 TaxID=2719615 RepID=UPI00235E3E4A|nr:trypsin-like serine protease [Halobacteriovorax sp. GB3]MDD0853607.1 trypsin-like serine protease [Halobacteriovorax sp. GB3]
MRYLFILVFNFLLFSNPSFAIVNEEGSIEISSDHPASYSSVALLDETKTVFCSGTLISSQIVLTAKHCLSKREIKKLYVYFGENTNHLNESLLRPLTEVGFYGQRDDGKISFPNFDAAWVRFKGKAPKAKKAITLFNSDYQLSKSDLIHLAGFGESSLDKWSSRTGVLGAAETTFDYFLNTNIYHHLILFDGQDGKGACHGDSGGPAYIQVRGKWYLLGLTNGFDVSLTPKSMRRTFLEQAPYKVDCKFNQSLYTHVGYLKNWLTKSTGLNFGTSEKDVNQVNEKHVGFKAWCENVQSYQSEWVTVKSLIEYVLDNQDIAFDRKKVLQSCSYTLEVLNQLKSFNLTRYYKLGSLAPLEDVDFNYVRITKRDLSGIDLSPLAKMPSLERLVLSKNNLHGNDTLKNLFRSKSLTAMDLSGNQIESIDIQNKNHVLQELDLSGNQLEDLSELIGLSHLKKLYLAEQSIRIDLRPLLEMSSLTDLDLYETDVVNNDSLDRLQQQLIHLYK